MTHPEQAHITGYVGDVTILVQMDAPIDAFKAGANSVQASSSKDKEFYKPVSVPVGTTALEFLFGGSKG